MASILIADIHTGVAEAARDSLVAAEFSQVLCASSPDEVRAALPTMHAPAVILLDRALMAADASLVQAVREAIPLASIVISSVELFEAPVGIDAVIAKPFDDARLLDVVATEVTRQIGRAILTYVPTILGVRRDNPTPEGIVCGGTGCLLALPTRRVLLTAKHVIDGTRRDDLHCLLTGARAPHDITHWEVIDSDESLDLATVGVPDDFDASSIEKTFYRSSTWPPERVVRGDSAFFLGFAGIHRLVVPGGVKQHSTVFNDFVSSSSSRHFLLADEELVRRVSEFVGGLALFGDTGGMSGAPVFVARSGKYELGGVLYEGGSGPDTTFFVAHADHVLSDGRIDRARF